jgi:hypothetical protein
MLGNYTDSERRYLAALERYRALGSYTKVAKEFGVSADRARVLAQNGEKVEALGPKALRLSTRSANALRNALEKAGYTGTVELTPSMVAHEIQWDRLFERGAFPNFGRSSQKEVAQWLRQNGEVVPHELQRAERRGVEDGATRPTPRRRGRKPGGECAGSQHQPRALP